jgi:nucleoside-triphosphatase THEP1
MSFDGASVQWAPFREAPTHLNNFSVLITGDAGSGKTQTIRVLIEAACQAGLDIRLQSGLLRREIRPSARHRGHRHPH